MKCDGSVALRGEVQVATVFRGQRSPDDSIGPTVRWYLSFRSSNAEVAEWPAKRGIIVDPATVYGWVQRYTPL
jgi:transposase-like protein